MELLEIITPIFFTLIVAGTFIGIVFSAIPGMTATKAVAVCLPLTYSLGPENGLALLLGLYVGGILPGVGGSAASILSYTAAKTFSRTPARFGNGEPAGIVAS
jgi:TctA family transporter